MTIMNLTIRFYSVSKDLAGRNETQISVPQSATLGSALELLFAEIPALRQLHPSSMYAIGVDYATLAVGLHEGDIISIIPPVQGG